MNAAVSSWNKLTNMSNFKGQNQYLKQPPWKTKPDPTQHASEEKTESCNMQLKSNIFESSTPCLNHTQSRWKDSIDVLRCIHLCENVRPKHPMDSLGGTCVETLRTNWRQNYLLHRWQSEDHLRRWRSVDPSSSSWWSFCSKSSANPTVPAGGTSPWTVSKWKLLQN